MTGGAANPGVPTINIFSRSKTVDPHREILIRESVLQSPAVRPSVAGGVVLEDRVSGSPISNVSKSSLKETVKYSELNVSKD